MRFFIKYLLIIFFVSMITTTYLLCCTTEGLIIGLQYTAHFLPGKLKIEKVSGTFFSGFSLQKISYQTKEEKINLQSFTTNWYPKQLLHGKLVIGSLLLEHPQITFFDVNAKSNNITLDDFAFLHYITIHHLVIHQLNIKKSDIDFNLTGELKNKWNFHWELNIPTCHVFYDNCSGSLIGSGSLTGERLFPLFNATVHSNHLKINNHPIKRIILTMLGTIAYKEHALSTKAILMIAQQPILFLHADFPYFSNFTNPKQPLTAALKLNVINLDRLHNMIPDIQNPQGILKGNININGTISKPEIMGTFYLTQGQFTLSTLGIHPKEIMAQAIFNKENILTLHSSFRSGKGTGELEGTIEFNKPNFPGKLTGELILQGKNLTAMNVPKFNIIISPNLKLNFDYSNVRLQGKIFIPEAAIKLKDLINTVTLPEETVFVGQPETKKLSFLSAAHLHITLDLGHDIFFNYKGLETHLKGKLLINQLPNSLATATGEITATRGRYSIYGQNLIIRTGRLIFAGNVITDPGLHIEAIRKAKETSPSNNMTSMLSLDNDINTDTTVGIRILGTLNNPQITLFSIPAGLTQTQILSALGGEGAALLGALSILNPDGSNSNGITDKFTKMIGLTEVHIASVETLNAATNQMQSTPSLVVGKKISQKLSLHYSIGIFNPVSVLNVRYQLSKHWAIQSETSTIDNGADILYGFERP